MSNQAIRPHLGLSVRDLATSVCFYRKLFGIEPSKQRPGYAKFELSAPPLNLSLNELPDLSQRLGAATHFGIELSSTAAVNAAMERARAAGLSVRAEMDQACCYSVQDKFWTTDPDGHRWEHFTVTDADSDRRAPDVDAQPADAERSDRSCCEPTCCGGSGAPQ